MTDDASADPIRCGFCGAGGFGNVEVLQAHELGCLFRPKNLRPELKPSTHWKAFAERLEKKAHDTKRLADESFLGNSATLIATAIMCIAKEAEAYAAELEKKGQ